MKKIVALALLALVALSAPAHAGFITVDLSSKNFSNPAVLAPFATLTISGDGTANGILTFDLKVDSPNSAFLNKLAFNTVLDPSNFKLDSVLIGNADATLSTGSFQMDGFGRYSVLFDNGQPGSSSGFSELKFTVDMLGGKTADPLLFDKFNSGAGNFPGSFDVAADFFPTTGGTGFIGDSVGPTQQQFDAVAPEPASMTMCAIAGACGLGVWWRKRRQAA